MTMLNTKFRIHLIFVIKVIFTIIFLVGHPAINELYIYPFSIVTIFYSFALAYNPDCGLIAIILLFTTILIILLSVITMLLGTLSCRARKVSAYLITIVMVIDFVVSFFVASIPLKIACIVASAISMVLCIRALKSK